MLAALLVALALLATRLPPRRDVGPPSRDWTFFYLMGYDNDLAPFGPTILSRIRDGVRTTDIAVVVLADFRGPGGVRRIEITTDGERRETLSTEDSVSPALLRDQLLRTAARFPARHYGIVLLDHGAGVGEMVLDEHPGGGAGPRWMRSRDVGAVLRRFRGAVAGEVGIVFLQQCGRGTVEDLYDFRGAAETVMASQTTVGAPNSYYAALFRWLADHPEATGAGIAETIAYEDSDYTSYVAVDGDRLPDLPARLAPVVDELTRGGTKRVARPPDVRPCYRCRIRRDETIYDLLHWLHRAYAANGLAPGSSAALAGLDRFVRRELIVFHHKILAHAAEIPTWTGIGLLVPATPAAGRRRADTALYRDCPVPSLW
jgi:hypothetical protein